MQLRSTAPQTAEGRVSSPQKCEYSAADDSETETDSNLSEIAKLPPLPQRSVESHATTEKELGSRGRIPVHGSSKNIAGGHGPRPSSSNEKGTKRNCDALVSDKENAPPPHATSSPPRPKRAKRYGSGLSGRVSDIRHGMTEVVMGNAAVKKRLQHVEDQLLVLENQHTLVLLELQTIQQTLDVGLTRVLKLLEGDSELSGYNVSQSQELDVDIFP